MAHAVLASSRVVQNGIQILRRSFHSHLYSWGLGRLTTVLGQWPQMNAETSRVPFICWNNDALVGGMRSSNISVMLLLPRKTAPFYETSVPNQSLPGFCHQLIAGKFQYAGIPSCTQNGLHPLHSETVSGTSLVERIRGSPLLWLVPVQG